MIIKSRGRARSRDKVKLSLKLTLQCLWLTNLLGWIHTTRSFHPQTHTILLSRDIARSHGILDLLCLYYSKAHGYHTLKGDDLL